MKQAVTVVAIDDDPRSVELVQAALSSKELEVLGATDPERGLELVSSRRPPIVLVDLMMPKLTGMEVLERIVQIDPSIDVLLMTAHYSTESAVEAIQKGACDYLNKPLDIQLLRDRIHALAADARRRMRSAELDTELLENSRFEGMVGHSPQMLELFVRIRRVAPHFRTVLVTGSTGTGKELIAQSLHRLSPASTGRFVACNCSAVTETLFESELFGYVKGAFTGANSDKMGLIEYANQGTLFLDEIGDMPLATQAKLLRVLQNWEVQRVGSLQTRTVDLRVVAATNRDLRALISERQFREDLYYRLAMIEVQAPALSERKEDLPLLTAYYVERFAKQYKKTVTGITRRAQILLARHFWPGNVRELENVIGNACMMASNALIDVRDLPEYLRKGESAADADEGMLPLDELERRHARRVLDRLGGNKVRTAEVLGISRATLYKILGDSVSSST